MTIHLEMESTHGVYILTPFFNGKAHISILIFINKDAINFFLSFLRSIENRPQSFYFCRFQDGCHQFCSCRLKTYRIGVSQKVLLLPAIRIIAKMAVDPCADVFGFTYINYFSLLIMEIINAGCLWQDIKITLRHIVWQYLLFGIAPQACLYMVLNVICQQFLK